MTGAVAPDPVAPAPTDVDGASPHPRPEEAARTGRTETMAGGILLGIVAVFAIVFRLHPGPIFLDDWGFRLVHPKLGEPLYEHVADLKSSVFVVAGAVLAAVVVVARDRLRALACLVGPVLAVVVVEWVLKPAVARRYAQVLSFPSGTTTAVAGVAAAWVLAVPNRIRPYVTVVAGIAIGLECIAVIGLQWHYPTDGICGALFGIGTVLLLDGVFHLFFNGAGPGPVAAPPVAGEA